MIRDLKALGRVLVAILAMGAVTRWLRRLSRGNSHQTAR
jgi:hypothetical protein